MSLAKAPFSAKGILPFLALESPDHAAACQRLVSLYNEFGDLEKAVSAGDLVVAPLLALLPHDGCAAAPLATIGASLVKAADHAAARDCLAPVVDWPELLPLGRWDRPWHYHSTASMTLDHQRATLKLLEGQCLLALGDRGGGEAALAEGARRADSAAYPTPFGLDGVRSTSHGDVADFRLRSLCAGARALRRRFEGHDASPYRKPKKPAKGAKPVTPDPTWLALARDYLDEVLAAIRPRAAAIFAGLEPHPTTEHPEVGAPQRAATWMQLAYTESALVHERQTDLESARRDLAKARWISALFDPAHRWQSELLAAVERLGGVPAPPG